MLHGSLWNSGVPCWSKNQPRPAVTLIHLIQTRIPTLIPTLARTPPRRILDPLLTRGDADELLLPLAEDGILRARPPAVVCEATLVDPLRAVVHGTNHLLHHHRPHAVALEMTRARLLLAAGDGILLVRRPRRFLRVTETDEATLVAIPLPTGETTVRPRLVHGMWMDGTVGMNGGAGIIIERARGMSDRLEVIGESMVAGDDR